MKHWIVMNVEDARRLAEVARRAEETVAGLKGSVEASVALLGDVTMVVEFPHRKYKAVERVVESAVQVPVAVYSRDPYAFRKPVVRQENLPA